MSGWPACIFLPWWRCDGVLMFCSTALLTIYSEFKVHVTNMCFGILVWDYLIFYWDYLVFKSTTIQNTSPGYMRAIWPIKGVMKCCIRWPGLHNYLTETELIPLWAELDCLVNEKQSINFTIYNKFLPFTIHAIYIHASILKYCWKTIPGTTSWNWLREWKNMK